MSRPSVTVNLDSNKFREYLRKNNITQAFIARSIGRGESYVCDSLRQGRMQLNAYNLMVKTLGVPQDTFILKVPTVDVAKVNPATSGTYWIKTEYTSSKVTISLMFGDDLVKDATAEIKGSSLKDFTKAINHATYLIHLFVEQDELTK